MPNNPSYVQTKKSHGFFFEFKEAIQSIKLILSQYHDIDLKSQSAIP